MTYAIGIDLGTTNSVVSVYRRGRVDTLLIDTQVMLPSVVSFRNDGSVLVGRSAKARQLIDPERTIGSAKRFMGDPAKKYPIGDKTLTPVDVATMILRKIVDAASETLGEKITDVVITVPAYFNDAQREDTKVAAQHAGLNVLRLLNEPTAAAISYGLDKGKNQTLMIYDLGGGTFDVSILEVVGNDFVVRAVGGDGQLGGDDFDNAIVNWVVRQIPGAAQSGGAESNVKEIRSGYQKLKEAAERAKIELSESDTTRITLPDFGGRAVDLELTLAQYNELIKPYLTKTIHCVETTLSAAKLTKDDINRVILVGGSTKNRAVREIVERELGTQPYVADRVDEIVSHGAAIQAAALALPVSAAVSGLPDPVTGLPSPMSGLPDPAPDVTVTEVVPHSLGISLLQSGTKNVYFQPIIASQTAYPCSGACLCWTVVPLQTHTNFTVFRGEDPDPKKNVHIGELVITVPRPSPNEVPMCAIFNLDADGIIHFAAVVPTDAASETALRAAENPDGTPDIVAIKDLVRQGRLKEESVKIQSSGQAGKR